MKAVLSSVTFIVLFLVSTGSFAQHDHQEKAIRRELFVFGDSHKSASQSTEDSMVALLIHQAFLRDVALELDIWEWIDKEHEHWTQKVPWVGGWIYGYYQTTKKRDEVKKLPYYELASALATKNYAFDLPRMPDLTHGFEKPDLGPVLEKKLYQFMGEMQEEIRQRKTLDLDDVRKRLIKELDCEPKLANGAAISLGLYSEVEDLRHLGKEKKLSADEVWKKKIGEYRHFVETHAKTLENLDSAIKGLHIGWCGT